MKILLCFLLTLILGLSNITFVSAEEAEVTLNEEVLKTAEFLKTVGMIKEDLPDCQKPITRADASRVLLNVKGFQAVSGTAEEKFYDISKETEYYAEIMTAYELGIISGYPDNTFRPNDEVKTDDFLVMLLRMLGYTDVAETYGGYLEGYRVLASDFKLYNNVDRSKEILDCENLIYILNNVVDVPVYKKVIENGEIKIDDDNTVLSEFHDIYVAEGVMKTNTVTSVSGNTASAGTIEVSGDVYYVSSSAFDEFLGYEVEVYYKDDKGIYEAVYVRPTDKNESVTVSLDKISDYSSYTLSYYNESDREKRVKLDPAFRVVFNDKALTDYVTDFKSENCIFKQPNGTATLVDYNGDNRFDSIFIKSYIDMILAKASTQDDGGTLLLSFEEMPNIKIDLLSENILVEAKAADGSIYTGDEVLSLTVGNVISIYPDKIKDLNGIRTVADDAEIIKMVESDASVTGSLEGIFEEDGKTVYKINGEKYTVSYDNYIENINLGDVRIFKLNAQNEIVTVEMPDETSNEMQYGYLIKTFNNTDDEKLTVRMLKSDGTVQMIECIQKLQFNGSKVKSFAAMEKSLNESAKLIISDKKDMSQLVKYKLNSDGKIVEIETIIDNEKHDDRLSLDSKKKNAMYRASGGVFVTGAWDNIKLEDGTMSGTVRGFHYIPKLIFRVPPDLEKEDKYYGLMKLKDEEKYNAEAWDIDENLEPGVMVCYSNGTEEPVGNGFGYFMFDCITEELGEDGTPQEMINGHNGVSKVSYILEDDGTSNYDSIKLLKEGDLVAIYGDNTFGIVRRAQIIQKIDEIPDLSTELPINMDIGRTQFVEVYSVSGKKLVTQRGPLIDGFSRKDKYPWQWIGDAGILRGTITYDATGGDVEIRSASIDDIRPAIFYGNEESSKLYTFEGFGNPTFLVIYNGL